MVTALGVVIALVLVTRLLPTQWHVLPPGWDSTFHLLLAKKILTAQLTEQARSWIQQQLDAFQNG